jgi:hypothetical protein
LTFSRCPVSVLIFPNALLCRRENEAPERVARDALSREDVAGRANLQMERVRNTILTSCSGVKLEERNLGVWVVFEARVRYSESAGVAGSCDGQSCRQQPSQHGTRNGWLSALHCLSLMIQGAS